MNMKSLLTLIVLGIFSLPTLSNAQSKPAVKPPAAAKKKGSTSVSPDIDFAPKNLVLSGKPGSIAQAKIMVMNKSTAEHTIEFFTEDFTVNEFGSSTSKKEKYTLPHVAKENIILSSTSFILKAQESKQIVINVRIPKDAKDEMFFKYTFRPTKESRKKVASGKGGKNKKDAGVAFYANLFVIAKVKVEGFERYELEFPKTDFVYDQKSKQVRIASLVKNSGNTHIERLSGVGVLLKDGKNIAKIDYGSIDTSIALMPKSVKRFQGIVSSSLTKGKYELIETFSDPDGKVIKVNRKTVEVK